MSEPAFWETKSLEQMSDAEWESLCDGCGRCCLQKLQDEDTDEVRFTRVACKLLNTENCQCSNYSNRFSEVADCLAVRPLTAEKLSWLPTTCAYRLLSEGKALKDWHPLISRSAQTVITSGVSMANNCISEENVPLSDYFQHVIKFDNQ